MSDVFLDDVEYALNPQNMVDQLDQSPIITPVREPRIVPGPPVHLAVSSSPPDSPKIDDAVEMTEHGLPSHALDYYSDEDDIPVAVMPGEPKKSREPSRTSNTVIGSSPYYGDPKSRHSTFRTRGPRPTSPPDIVVRPPAP